MYTIRKFARDLLVATTGTLLLYAGTQPLPVEVPLEIAPWVAPLALVLYRLARERSAFLQRTDPSGQE